MTEYLVTIPGFKILVRAEDQLKAETAAMEFLDNNVDWNEMPTGEIAGCSYTMSDKLVAKEHDPMESCPKCGRKKRRSKTYQDEGTGSEYGRMFYYCSARCKETH